MSPRRARPRPDIAYVTKSPESVLWGRTITHADLKPEIKKEENVTSGLKGQQLAAANAAAADQRAAMAKAKGRYTSLGGQKYMWYLDEIRTQRQIRLFEESQQKAAAKVVMDPDLAAAPGARGVTTQVSLGSLAQPLDTEMPFSLVLALAHFFLIEPVQESSLLIFLLAWPTNLRSVLCFFLNRCRVCGFAVDGHRVGGQDGEEAFGRGRPSARGRCEQKEGPCPGPLQ
jgi:hypothetical protein